MPPELADDGRAPLIGGCSSRGHGSSRTSVTALESLAEAHVTQLPRVLHFSIRLSLKLLAHSSSHEPVSLICYSAYIA